MRADRAGLGARTELRLLWLMFARVVLSLVSLGIAAGLEALGSGLDPGGRPGLYWTVCAAFLATAVSAALYPSIRSAERFAASQLATDVFLVTSLVHFSGGHESIFSGLYLCVTIYGALLFERRGAVGAASGSALAYGAMLWARNAGGLSLGAEVVVLETPVLMTLWAVHVGAFFLVGALAATLAGELSRTGEALDQRTDALERLHDVHERIVESIMSGLLTTNSRECITSFNPEAERITGVPAAEAIGRPLESLIPGAGDALAAGRLEGIRGAGARSRLEFEAASGERKFLGLAGSPLRQGEGHHTGHVLIFQDVTRVVEMEEELRRSERLAALGEMAAKIAHEIRNPLAAISGSVEMLGGGGPGSDPDPESAHLMGIVLRETERLDGLIGDFLGYARPREPELEPVALAPLFDDLESMLAGLREPGLETRFEIEPALRVLADPGQLRQVLWNLCLNGIQAMEGRGCIRVEARAAGPGPQGGSGARRNGDREGSPGGAPVRGGDEGVVISVSDEGCGIPPEAQERIFDPFFTTKKEGSGLGLATVHRILEAHGAALGLDSAPGRGTRFEIRLQAAGDEEAA